VRVLGVDPGLTRCGLGVVEGRGTALTALAVGVARTGADQDIATRLRELEVQIEAWISEHRPEAVAVERVFAQHNVRTVMGTAQAGAVAILCAARHGLPVALHTPSEVKAAVTGSGRADKAQVTVMVTRLLKLGEAPRPADAAEGLVIASVRGTVLALGVDAVVVEVGGVGLSVLATPDTLAGLRISQEATLHTSLVVREDSLTLFGFADADQRGMFEALQTATGIGPKVAQAVLSVHSPDDVRRAVAVGDVPALMKVPGIGRKGAERMAIELKDRLGAPHGVIGPARSAPPVDSWEDCVRSALAGLGYAPREIDAAMTAITAEDAPGDVQTGLRRALAVLRRG
jgi:Holliday junction DNA helicase RuvA